MSFNIANYGKKKTLKYPEIPYEKMDEVRGKPIGIVSVIFDDYTTEGEEGEAVVKALFMHIVHEDGHHASTFTTSKTLIDVMEDVITNYKGFAIEKGCEYPLGEKVRIELVKSKKGGRSYNTFVSVDE